jgi:WS/DGAT/MGAT family acyltransferase
VPTDDRLTDSDALMWRIEADPVLRSPIVVVGLLDREPAPAAVRAALGRAAEGIPRLHQRVEARGGPLRWVDDPAFSLDHHLRSTAVAGGGVGAVLAVAEPDAAGVFDPVRPLWQFTLVTGLDGDRAGFVLRFHHTITDGVGGVALAEHLFDRTRRPGRASAAAPHPEPDVNGAGGGSEAAGAVRGLPGAVAGTARAAVGAATDPLGALRGAWRTTRSVARMLAPTGPPLSPILLERSIDRRLQVLETPFAGLAAAAHAAGGTVNDAFLAAVGGGLHAYHEALGAPVRSVRVTMPISLRTSADAPGGNRFTPARFVLPVDDPDPARRTLLAGAIVRRIRTEPAVGLTNVLATALNRLPGPVVTSAFGAMLRSIDVDAVDVPGLRDAAFLAGARLERMWAFAPPTGAAMSVTLVSHGDVATIGLATDEAAVDQPELLATCLARAVDEVLAIGSEDAACSLIV